MQKRLFLLLLLLGAWTGIPANILSAQSIQLEPITGIWEGKTKPISITSSDARALQLARHAFGVHGAFHVRDDGGFFTIRLTPQSDTQILLEILSGNPAEVQFSQKVSGSDKDDTILRACDLAVRKITGDPGFFAGQLVFISDRTGKPEVYRSDLFFNKIFRITQHNNLTLSPHWSPDANRVTYTSYFRTGFPDLYLYDRISGKVTLLAGFKGTNTGGVFDPFASRMALVLSSAGNPEIYIANVTGQQPRRITNNRSIEASPTWSPDGRSLIVTSDTGGSPQLYMISADGGSLKRLGTNISHYCSEPDWNPIHPELVVFTASNAKGFQLALHNMESGESRWLTAGGGDNIEPVWLSDGRHIVFTQRAGSQQRLHVMDVESGKISPLHATRFGNSSQADFVYTR